MAWPRDVSFADRSPPRVFPLHGPGMEERKQAQGIVAANENSTKGNSEDYGQRIGAKHEDDVFGDEEGHDVSVSIFPPLRDLSF